MPALANASRRSTQVPQVPQWVLLLRGSTQAVPQRVWPVPQAVAAPQRPQNLWPTGTGVEHDLQMKLLACSMSSSREGDAAWAEADPALLPWRGRKILLYSSSVYSALSSPE